MTTDDITTIINAFIDHLKLNYMDVLYSNAQKGLRYLTIDFSKLAEEDPIVSERLLENPEDMLNIFSMAIDNMDLLEDAKGFEVYIKNLPQSEKMMISDKRTVNIGKLLSFEGVVRTKSTVNPRVKSVRFECPSCGNVMTILQNENSIKEPSRCGCGRKGKFRQLSKEMIDAQFMQLEELPENVKGNGQPQAVYVYLKNGLVSPLNDSKYNPGSKVLVNGILKEIADVTKSGAKSVDSKYLFEAVYLENIDSQDVDIRVDDDDLKQINDIAKSDKWLQTLVNAYAPSIYGNDIIKEALLIQCVSAQRIKESDGTTKRGDLHILLIGDPGCAKSKFLERTRIVRPEARYSSGKGASGVGLTASVQKDELMGGYTFRAGTLVLANRGIALLDEFDKVDEDDRAHLHEAMEQQTVTISKAGIQATLRCECSILAAANPKLGRFDLNRDFNTQIDLPVTLISRFDLIIPFVDIANEENDRNIFNHVMKGYNGESKYQSSMSEELLRKYIFVAKKIETKIPEKSIKYLEEYYVSKRIGNNGKSTITVRQAEALARIAISYAKLRLSSIVEVKDVKSACDLFEYCFRKLSPGEDGQIDFDRIATGISSGLRDKIRIVSDLISEMTKEIGDMVPTDELSERAKSKGVDEASFEQCLEKLRRSGDIFEPRRGFVKKI